MYDIRAYALIFFIVLNTNLGKSYISITDDMDYTASGSDSNGNLTITGDGTIYTQFTDDGILQISDNWQNMTGKSYNLNDYTTVGKYYFPYDGGTLTNQPNGAVDGWLEVLPVRGTTDSTYIKQIWHRLGSQKKTPFGYPSYFDEAVRIFGQGKTDGGTGEWSKWAMTPKVFDGQYFGAYWSTGDSVTKSVPSSTATVVNSITLPEDGNYLVISCIEYAKNGTGVRYNYQNQTTSYTDTPGFYSSIPSNSSYPALVSHSAIWQRAKGTKIYSIAWQNSGSTLSTRSVMYILKNNPTFYTGY